MSTSITPIANIYNNTRIYLLDINKHNSNNESPNNKPSSCGSYVIIGPSSKEGHTLVRRQFCKTYGCVVCGELKRYEMIKNIARLLLEHNLNIFATLTLPLSACSPENSVRKINKMWNQHRIMQNRELQRSPKFVKVIEFQKNGMAHLHVLFDQYIPQDWLESSWKKLDGGFVHIKKANPKHAYYMGKYLSKSNDRARYGNYRRISASKGLKLNSRTKNPNFNFSMAYYERLKSTFSKRISEISVRKSGLETGFVLNGPVSIYRDPK